jgi:hypothetical protein
MWTLELDSEVGTYLINIYSGHAKSIKNRLEGLREDPYPAERVKAGDGRWLLNHWCGQTCYLIAYTTDDSRRSIFVAAVTRD